MGGSSPLFGSRDDHILLTAAISIVKIAHIIVCPEIEIINTAEVMSVHLQESNFLETKSLGVLPPKRCLKCKGCNECTNKALRRSRKDQEELELLRNSIKIENGELVVNYPFIKDPCLLPYNKGQVIKMATKLESRLDKEGLLDTYNIEFQKYLDRQTFVEVTDYEIKNYKGPVQFILHHGVLSSSATTPLRIVTNASFKNGIRSLKDCLPKGPNCLHSMYGVGIRFRSYEEGVVFDLSKAYNKMKTGLVEKHL